MSFVYFIKPVGMDGPIKIGFTKSAEQRLTNLTRWSPFPLELLVAIPGGQKLEYAIHGRFAHAHQRNEWFTPTPEMLDAIAKLKAGVPVEQAINLKKPTGSIRNWTKWSEERREYHRAALRESWARRHKLIDDLAAAS